jgi:predicted amidohydrolase YtcJ
MHIAITLAGSWEWVGTKPNGQVESSPPQYVHMQLRCFVTHHLSLAPPAMKDDLDREPLLRGRPVLLVRVDYHAYLVSNAILSNLRDLPDVVDGGLIVRDGAGKPTGRFEHPRMIRAPPLHLATTFPQQAFS